MTRMTDSRMEELVPGSTELRAQEELDARLEHLGFDYMPESSEWSTTKAYISFSDYGDGLRHIGVVTDAGQFVVGCEKLTAADIELWSPRKLAAEHKMREEHEQYEREHREHLRVEESRQRLVEKFG